jgi:peptidyl-prolyl cis-trans isomerase C
MPLVVNGESIPASEIDREIAKMRPHYRARFSEQPIDEQDRQLREWAKENIIEQALLRQAARNEPDGVDGLILTLCQSVSQPSVDELHAEYEHRREEFRIPELIRAGQIVVHEMGNRTLAAARVIMEHVLGELGRDTSFEELAARYSDEPGNEGDLGWLGRGEMEDDVERAAFALRPGQTSDIIHCSHGYHIVCLFDRRSERQLLCDEVKNEITSTLRQRAEQRAVEEYVDQLRSRAEIKDEES